MISIIHHPDGAKRLGDLLTEHLKSDQWTSFRAAIAFAKRSGTKHIAPSLNEFAKRRKVTISLGIDHCGTSFEAAEDLLSAIGNKGELWILHNEAASHPTFHPKVYLFSNSKDAECFIGSGNLTEGGLFTNYEVFTHLRLNRERTNHKELLTLVEDSLDLWTATPTGVALRANRALLADLRERGYLPTEARIRHLKAVGEKLIKAHGADRAKKIFPSVPVRPAPRVSGVVGKRAALAGETVKPEENSTVTGFVITLQNTDVGFGQKTKGAARRSAELFVPKVCVQAEPDFWGWPNLFTPDPNWTKAVDGYGFGKMDRKGVHMRLGSTILSVNWWYNPDKRDYRMRNEALRSAGNVGDILRIELAPNGSDYDYYVEIIPQGTSQFETFAALCTESVRNSPKKYGYY